MILLFSAVLYGTFVVKNRPLSKDQLIEISGRRPATQQFVLRLDEFDEVKTLSELAQERERDRFTSILSIIIPPSLLISALVAYLVASYLVKPIEDVTYSVGMIGRENLQRRIPQIKSSEEIESLIGSFNSLLDDLEEAFELQEQFIQDAAHEIRTPLAAMKANIDIFKEVSTKATKPELINLVGILEKLNTKLIHLNEKLLILNRNSKGNINKKKSDINEIINDAYDSVSTIAKKENVEFRFKLGKISKIKIDPDRIVLAVKNIFDNAIKFKKGDSGEVTVLSDQDESFVTITIKDRGQGISPKDIRNVFKRFYRSDEVSNIEGDGLGLSITKRMIELNGGTIEVSSRLNSGTQFTIKLPRE
ncbi:MAG TPA: HAMP domain-containing sensor histidine kinase [Candidatus Dojkabacteria bacterium]